MPSLCKTRGVKYFVLLMICVLNGHLFTSLLSLHIVDVTKESGKKRLLYRLISKIPKIRFCKFKKFVS